MGTAPLLRKELFLDGNIKNRLWITQKRKNRHITQAHNNLNLQRLAIYTLV